MHSVAVSHSEVKCNRVAGPSRHALEGDEIIMCRTEQARGERLKVVIREVGNRWRDPLIGELRWGQRGRERTVSLQLFSIRAAFRR
jgi:hypothetical protein